MNKRILQSCCLAALVASGALAAEEEAEAPAPSTPVSGDTSVATINGLAIPLDMFRLYFADRLRQGNAQNTPAFQNRAFNEFVNIVVTAQDAEGNGLDKQKEIGYLLDLQRLQALSRAALQNVANTTEPTDEELQNAYDERIGKEKRTEYKARHILVKTEEEGKQVIEELKGGADFIELAKEKSLGPTGKNGGDLGWFGSDQMVKPFTEAVAAMEPGTSSSSPVQTQFGWHVILLEETRESDPPSMEQVKPELTAALQRDALSKYVADLRNAAELELNSDLIKVNETGEPAAATTGEATE
jgi:peptidyl-prolyl cis-trans isomerase C